MRRFGYFLNGLLSAYEKKLAKLAVIEMLARYTTKE